MSITFPIELPISELEVGDVVQVFDGPFGTAIVDQVEEDKVWTFRPYGATSGFTMIGNKTITYTGQERMSYLRDSKTKLKVWERRPHR